ncbi:hypothetical protein BDY19DRAFT_1026532 [Irpex rosettiformis]|uniref:Uncharacterized protein n=1 Tax=Irpex rosettiformis TaxID=378272 RepID=A0ACB8TQV8_9APHY|nr:hypothetical protein BDY19DRAFT_1026532 [Irpex rosettiformis]
MGLAATVYAEILSRYGHGHPLWYPEPSEGLDRCRREIQLGDVGYIDAYGGFRRLFNITVGPEHELNAGGVPVDFTPIVFSQALRRDEEKALGPGPLCIRSLNVGCTFTPLSVRTTPASGGAELSYSFSCKSHSGAYLVLTDHARNSWFEPNSQFKEYMRQHHGSWYAFAADPKKLGLECNPEDIILVRGTTKTSTWTVGAFISQENRAHDFTAGGQVASVGGAKVTFSSGHELRHKCEQRTGPDRAPANTTSSLLEPLSSLLISGETDARNIDSTDPQSQNNEVNRSQKDQCIFLSYYKLKHRLFLPKKIVANAGPSPLGDGADDGEGTAVRAMDIEIESEPGHTPVSINLPLLTQLVSTLTTITAAANSSGRRIRLYPSGTYILHSTSNECCSHSL